MISAAAVANCGSSECPTGLEAEPHRNESGRKRAEGIRSCLTGVAGVEKPVGIE